MIYEGEDNELPLFSLLESGGRRTLEEGSRVSLFLVSPDVLRESLECLFWYK